MITMPDQMRMSVTHRLVSEDSFAEGLAERAVAELEKFLEFCAHNPDRRFTPSDPVDKAWHAAIVHTASYRDFCRSLTGGSFIDHTPPRSADEARRLTANFPATVEAMRGASVELDAELWSSPSHSSCGCGS